MPQSPSFNYTATGLGKETTYNVPVTPTIWVSAQDITMTGTNELLERTSARQQVGREEAETGAFGGAGTFTLEADPDVIAPILAWGWGNDTNGTPVLNGTAHNFSSTISSTLNGAVAAGVTALTVAAGAGFTVTGVNGQYILDPNTPFQEIVRVNSVAGNVLTLNAATLYPHANGATIISSAAYDHTLYLAIPRPTFTLQFKRITDNIQYSGCKISTVDVTLQPRQIMAMRFGVVYASEGTVSGNTPAFSPQRPYRVIDPSNTATVNGSEASSGILSGSFSLNCGLQPSEYVLANGRIITNIPEGQSRVNGSLVLQFTSEQMQQLFWGGASATGPQSSVTGVSLSFGVVSPSFINPFVPYQIQIVLPNVKITSAPTAGRSGNPLQQTVNFEAYQSAAGANDDMKLIVTTAGSTSLAP